MSRHVYFKNRKQDNKEYLFLYSRRSNRAFGRPNRARELRPAEVAETDWAEKQSVSEIQVRVDRSPKRCTIIYLTFKIGSDEA